MCDREREKQKPHIRVCYLTRIWFHSRLHTVIIIAECVTVLIVYLHWHKLLLLLLLLETHTTHGINRKTKSLQTRKRAKAIYTSNHNFRSIMIILSFTWIFIDIYKNININIDNSFLHENIVPMKCVQFSKHEQPETLKMMTMCSVVGFWFWLFFHIFFFSPSMLPSVCLLRIIIIVALYQSIVHVLSLSFYEVN